MKSCAKQFQYKMMIVFRPQSTDFVFPKVRFRFLVAICFVLVDFAKEGYFLTEIIPYVSLFSISFSVVFPYKYGMYFCFLVFVVAFVATCVLYCPNTTILVFVIFVAACF